MLCVGHKNGSVWVFFKLGHRDGYTGWPQGIGNDELPHRDQVAQGFATFRLLTRRSITEHWDKGIH